MKSCQSVGEKNIIKRSANVNHECLRKKVPFRTAVVCLHRADLGLSIGRQQPTRWSGAGTSSLVINAGRCDLHGQPKDRLSTGAASGRDMAGYKDLEAFGDNRHFYTQLAPFSGLALSLGILWAILRRFNATSQLSSNVIAEALISYLVIASAFCQIYWILNRMLTNPFNQVVSPHHIHTLLYFSMVTLSTVGYGGIAPINPYVRMVAAIESIIGVFYIAVVVARLVASYEPRFTATRCRTS